MERPIPISFYPVSSLIKILREDRFVEERAQRIEFAPLFKKSIIIFESKYQSVEQAVATHLQLSGFRIKKKEETPRYLRIFAMKGRVILTYLANFPLDERGKRLGIHVSIAKQPPLELCLSIEPYMAFFDFPEEDGSGLSQGDSEKYVDDLACINALNLITKGVLEDLGQKIPEDILNLDWEKMLYISKLRMLSHSYSQLKKDNIITLPPKNLPKWNADAILFTEQWIWKNKLHVFFTINTAFADLLLFLSLTQCTSIVSVIIPAIIFISNRLLIGRVANLLYFSKNGKLQPESRNLEIG